MQVRGLREVRGLGESQAAAERPAIALDLDDLYVAGEPVTLHARLVNSPGSPGSLRAHIEPVGTPSGASARTVEFTEAPGGWVAGLEALPPGLYRVEVAAAKAGPAAPSPVHDLFEVAGST
jgi:hypothetical protein